jgi:hypothetical protein
LQRQLARPNTAGVPGTRPRALQAPAVPTARVRVRVRIRRVLVRAGMPVCVHARALASRRMEQRSVTTTRLAAAVTPDSRKPAASAVATSCVCMRALADARERANDSRRVRAERCA